MRKKTKKISKSVRDQLQYLVEEFLEKSGKEIAAKINGHRDVAKTLWEHLDGTLFADTFWMDEVEPEDKTKIEYEKLLREYHVFLKPIWDQFRDALFDYKYGIIPAREQLQRSRKNIDRDKESAFSEYRSLLKGDTVLDWEKIYDITLRVSFDPGTVTFYGSNLNVVTNLIDLLSGVEIEHFGRCEYCGKCIVLKRSDKRFCPGCAAKKIQKDKWESDPEGMKKKERVRYREKRKKS